MDGFHELMGYYHLQFAVVYAIALIPLLNFIRILLRKSRPNKYDVAIDLSVNALIFVGVFVSGIFQGVIADLSVGNEYIKWLYQLMGIGLFDILMTGLYCRTAYKRFRKSQ